MPWYGTVLISFFSAALGAAFAWIGIYIQLRHDKEKDKRQWSRQVRSEPLLAFRKQMATTAEICRKAFDITVISIFDTELDKLIPVTLPEHEREKIKKDTLAEFKLGERLQNAQKELTTHWQSGEFQRSMYELDDEKIINMAKNYQELVNNSLKLILDIGAQRLTSKEEDKDHTIANVKNQLKKLDDTIVEIQHLINQRLQEL